MAGVVTGDRAFDFDHIRPEIGQHLGAPRACQYAGEVQNFEALEFHAGAPLLDLGDHVTRAPIISKRKITGITSHKIAQVSHLSQG